MIVAPGLDLLSVEGDAVLRFKVHDIGPHDCDLLSCLKVFPVRLLLSGQLLCLIAYPELNDAVLLGNGVTCDKQITDGGVRADKCRRLCQRMIPALNDLLILKGKEAPVLRGVLGIATVLRLSEFEDVTIALISIKLEQNTRGNKARHLLFNLRFIRQRL